MKSPLLAAVVCAVVAAAVSASRPVSHAAQAPTGAVEAAAASIALPGGGGGIGCDDLIFASRLSRVLVPAGRAGMLALVEVASRQVVTVGGLSGGRPHARGHGGTSSADFGRGLVFASDRTANELVVIDPAARKVVARTGLASAPDQVRWVEPTSEIWVTEPDHERIEIFTLPAGEPPAPKHRTFVAVHGGPKSLLVDAAGHRAYSHLWKGASVAIDLKTHAIAGRWANGCQGSRGIAFDPDREFLFAGCAEGKAVVLDLRRGGAVLDSWRAGPGVDLIAYNRDLGHLYLPGGESGTMAVLGVSSAGKLSHLATVETARGAHCVAADDHHQVWVCDPRSGRLLLVEDSYRSSK